jgi:hypothetical protein
MKYLVNWNDEYLNMRIVTGPFNDTEKEEYIKDEVIEQIQYYYGITEGEAKYIYEDKRLIKEEDSVFPEIDLNIYNEGASLIYGSGYESRLEIVEYDTNPEFIVPTEIGDIKVRRLSDEEYPGVAVLFDQPGEPGTISEYDPNRKCFVVRVFSMENPEGDPSQIIEFRETEKEKRSE